MRFRKSGHAVSHLTRNILHEAQDRQSIKTMLGRGAVETTIGATTHLRLASGGYAAFPTALVEAVRREKVAAANPKVASLDQDGPQIASEAPPAGFGSMGATLPPEDK